MWSGGPKPGGSSASRSVSIPFVPASSPFTVIEKLPRSISDLRPAEGCMRRGLHSSSCASFHDLLQPREVTRDSLGVALDLLDGKAEPRSPLGEVRRVHGVLVHLVRGAVDPLTD